jgi:mannitol 2-dehydrogenase
MAIKVSSANLAQIAATMKVPTYDRSAVTAGIVHIGLGNFQRAHQAVYTDKVLAKGATEWGICGVGIMPWDAEMRDALKAQDNLYTLMTKTGDRVDAQVVGSVVDYVFAVDQPALAVEKMAAPTTKIVSMTVTEKGYSQDQVTGDLNFEDAAIQHDLANIATPKTTIGFIVSALSVRKEAGSKSFTVMTCDNLQANGDMTKKLVLQFANKLNPELAQWIEANTAFPNSMVDRITPRTTDEVKEFLKTTYKVDDAFPVKSEEFIQWVIEDKFCDGRPNWEGLFDESDVIYVQDVHPFELMKLRLLNGGHSSLAYFSHLLGHEMVEDAMADPLIVQFVQKYMEQATIAVPEVPIDLTKYKAQLVERFSNPLGDQVARIEMDGAKKLKEFVGGTISEIIAKNGDYTCAAMLFASWIRIMTGVDEKGEAFTINDGAQDTITPLAKNVTESNGYDPKAVTLETFGPALAENAEFNKCVADCLASLYKNGAKTTLTNYLQDAKV